MPKTLHAEICGNFEIKDRLEFLRRVYAEFKGTTFGPPRDKHLSSGGKNLLENDFKIISEKIKDNPKEDIFIEANFPGRLKIRYLENKLYIYIKCDAWFFYHGSLLFHRDYEKEGGFSERQIARGKENLRELIELCKLLLKYSKASYFYGAIEAFGSIESACDIQFLYCKESEYPELLQKYVKEYFKVQLNESEIKRIVEKTAEITIDGEYVLLNFMRIQKDALFPQNIFNEAVKQHLEEKTKHGGRLK